MQPVDLALPAPYQLVVGRHGPFLVNTLDVYVGNAIATYGECCEIDYGFFRQLVQPNRDAVEVGSNIGCHTVPLARQLGAQGRRLLAVEPQPVVFQNLCANLALNRLLNVQAENCACTDTAARLSFEVPDYTARYNFGGISMQTTAERTAGALPVRGVPLDDLLDDTWDVGFIKIDVEGFEQRVLEGARKTIARHRPFIYLENDRVDKSRALIEWLWAAGYKLWFHVPRMFNPANFAQRPDNIYGSTASFNMVAMPNETPVDGDPPISDADAHPLKKK